jgi:hypothetical protein
MVITDSCLIQGGLILIDGLMCKYLAVVGPRLERISPFKYLLCWTYDIS